MDSSVFSDEEVTIPLVCEQCETWEVLEGRESALFTVSETGTKLGDDEWYLHLFVDSVEIKDGEVEDCELVALCETCAPETALSDADLRTYLDA